jgi:hypothetical protein
MNQTQKKYALERIDILKDQKIKKLRQKYTRKGKRLTDKERYLLIKDGKVQTRSEKEFDKFTYQQDRVNNVFVFSKYEWDSSINHKEYDPLESKIIKEARRIKDQIMLGDAEEALKMIQGFEYFTGE